MEVVEYYATDAVGSVRVVFNADGQVAARADFQPFGELFAPVGELPPQQFTGQARDGEAGLDYFGARFYQPRHGRFTQVDPVYAGLFDPQQWNRYTYARANPLSFVDPDGRHPGIRIWSWSWSWLAEFLGGQVGTVMVGLQARAAQIPSRASRASTRATAWDAVAAVGEYPWS